MALAAIASLHLGLNMYGPRDVATALFSPSNETTDIVIRNLRVPRTVLACLVGASLGIAGAVMQSCTRNPLAEPGLMGVNAGAAFALVAALSLFGVETFLLLSAIAAAGAVLASLLVFGLALSARAVGPGQVLLAGVTVAALLASLTQMLLVTDEQALEALLFWLAGSFADRPVEVLLPGASLLLLTTVALVPMIRALDALALSDEAAQAIGVSVTRTRLVGLGLAALMAGLCVALAGPVAFAGLLAPHLARLMGARGHAQLLPIAALLGALTCLLADVAARMVIMPGEAPVGVLLALLGAPTLIVLLDRRRAGRAEA
ncbi:FecCD family ABC transporter permease [Pontivivens ytuae]|uniref:FecCD family ABC transporter permease n=1 Tax=Pontivivens ytuae TaxID=2789856 RepID=UPI001E41371A|nr:iron ABC transporter permease [Pontivivens ytuae]